MPGTPRYAQGMGLGKCRGDFVTKDSVVEEVAWFNSSSIIIRRLCRLLGISYIICEYHQNKVALGLFAWRS